jgi:hypothetical protein
MPLDAAIGQVFAPPRAGRASPAIWRERINRQKMFPPLQNQTFNYRKKWWGISTTSATIFFAKLVKLVSGGQLSRMYECRIGIKNGVLWIFYTVNTILVPP